MDAKGLRIEAMQCTKAIWDSIREGEEPPPALAERLSGTLKDIHEFIPKHSGDIKSSFLASRPDNVEKTLQELATANDYLRISVDLLGCVEKGESALSVYIAARDIIRGDPLTQELPGKIHEAEYKGWTLTS